jgi:hypothetical protein
MVLLRVIKTTLVYALATVSLLAMGISAAYGQQAAILVKSHLEPADIVNHESSQLIVEVQSTQPVSNLHVQAIAPPGFEIQPSALADLPVVQGHYTFSSVSVVRSDPNAAIGTRSIQVRVLNGTGPTAIAVGDTSVPFAYIARLSIVAYLLLGGVGIIFGYCLRILIKLLQTIPTPPLAPLCPALHL